MVIISDKLTDLVKKGEITPRYYNPTELFDEVHIVATNRATVEPEQIQKTVGKARLYLHYLPIDRRVFAVGLIGICPPPLFLTKWMKAGVQLAKSIQPDLIRCYANDFNALLAAQIKKELGIPFIVSLHNNPNTDFRGGREILSFRGRLYASSHYMVERPALKSADHFIAVYSPIVPYLEGNNVKDYSVIYNAVGYGAKHKDDYAGSKPVRFICVGRQKAHHKDPTHIIEALSELQEAQLTLIGTGKLHPELENLAKVLGCENRCNFIPELPNERVMAEMARADVFVFNQLYLGISKAIIEAALTGLPIIVNTTSGSDELATGDGDWLIRVNDSKEGYLGAMRRLMDQKERELLGRRAYAHACDNWAPEQMESKIAQLYLKVIDNSRTQQGRIGSPGVVTSITSMRDH